MGSNYFKDLGIDPQEKIGTEDFEKLWNKYAQNKTSVDRKAAAKFIKELCEVVHVQYNKQTAKNILDEIDRHSPTLDKTQFQKLFLVAATELEGKKQKKGKEARIALTTSLKSKSKAITKKTDGTLGTSPGITSPGKNKTEKKIQKEEDSSENIPKSPTSSRIHKKPEKSEKTPGKMEKTPVKMEKTPVKMEKTPGKTEKPEKTEKTEKTEAIEKSEKSSEGKSPHTSEPEKILKSECEGQDSQSPDPSKCDLKEILELKENQETNLTCLIKDMEGKPYKSEIDLEVTAILKKEKLVVHTSSNYNGVVGIRFTPISIGSVVLEIRVGGRQIKGSPYKMLVEADLGPTTFSQRGVIEIESEGPPKMTNTYNANINISPDGLELWPQGGYGEYPTARGTVKVSRGRWLYEVTVRTGTTGRIGWASSQYVPANNVGIGADESSWAFDLSGKRYHRDTAGTPYGEGSPRAGDVYGCCIDFQLRRMWFLKNGRSMGVAFANVRVEGVYPVLSVSHNTRLAVNFGKNFKYPVRSTFSLNPTLPEREKKSLEKIFRGYHAAGVAEEGDTGEYIKGQGLLDLNSTLGQVKPLDPHFLIFAWKLNCRAQWECHKDEFMTALALEGASTREDMIKVFNKWMQDTQQDEEIYRSWYAFVYDYLKAKQATVLAPDEAVMAWTITGIPKRWSVFPKWEEYIKSGKSVKGINADTWLMLLALIEKVGDDVNKFDEADCWPSCIEDFVLDVWKS